MMQCPSETSTVWSHSRVTAVGLSTVVLVAMVATGCRPETWDHDVSTPGDTSVEHVRSAIEAANADINALLKAGRYDEAGQYFAHDVVQLISGQPPIQGRNAWIATQREAAQIGTWDLQLEVLNLEVRGDLAVERGRGVQTFTAHEDSPMPSFTSVGDYVVLWKKIDGRWQIHWDYVVIEGPGNRPLD